MAQTIRLATNTIIGNPIGGENCASFSGSDAIQDYGGNLQWGDSSCAFTITVADPKLGALADNGGPTQTLALQSDSPAIDAVQMPTVVSSAQIAPNACAPSFRLSL